MRAKHAPQLTHRSMSSQFYRAIVGLLFLIFVLGPMSQGCDTGFGQPCTLPQSEQLNAVCNEPPSTNEEEEGAEREFKATCALDNFPTCETQSCIVYRGSPSYCSMRCAGDSDCQGQGTCCPLFGECQGNVNAPTGPTGGAPGAQMSLPASACGDGLSPCYCIRKADLNR